MNNDSEALPLLLADSFEQEDSMMIAEKTAMMIFDICIK
jgi:hypothetical protein